MNIDWLSLLPTLIGMFLTGMTFGKLGEWMSWKVKKRINDTTS
jgi:hypothetical protein